MVRNKHILILLVCISSYTYASLVSPTNDSNLNYVHILFEWEQENDAESYNFQLSPNSSFSNLLVDFVDESLMYIDTANINWDSSYNWRVRSQYSNGSYGDWIDTYSLTTGSTRSNAYSINTDDNAYQNGVTLFSSFFNYYSAMIDQNGNEIWNTGNSDIVYYTTDYYGQLFGCYVNNNLENYLPGIEFSLDNEFIWEEPNDNFLHHELMQLADGNYIGLVETIQLGPIPGGPWIPTFQQLGYEADGITNEFPWVGDKLIIWDKDTKNIIWEWNSFDYFNMIDYDDVSDTWNQAINLGRFDWTHANAFYVAYNDNLIDKIYLSSRQLSRITKINYNTKDIDWNIGIDMPSGDVDCGQNIGFSFQHSLTVTNEGNIVILDNGNLSVPLFGADYPTTRGLEIEVIENGIGCSTNIIWEYSLPENYFGFASGNVQKLDNGNYLIVTVGDGGTALEVDSENNHIWEGKFNLQLPNGAVYRANRVSGLYPVAYNVIIPDMYDNEQGSLFLDIIDLDFELLLNNEGTSSETYSIFINPNNHDGYYLNDIMLLSNSTENVIIPFIEGTEYLTIIITPTHRSDLSKTINLILCSNGICGEFNECDGEFDACGICNGPGDIYDCGCTNIPEDACDCENNILDDCGVCNGNNESIDCDGVCNGTSILDNCGICNGDGSSCGSCNEGFTFYENIPNSTIVFDGSKCFNDIDLNGLNDIITLNALNVESPIHLGTQNWTDGRITRLEAGNYYQGGTVVLTIIPESIGNMSELSVLYLNYNELTQLPESITSLTNLIYLVLSFNQLTSLPTDIGNLTNLYWIDVGYNELESIPNSIGNLQGLVYLWIFNNNLTYLPESICNLSINWDSDDYSFLPYFGAGGNQFCDGLPDCVESSSNLLSSVDPLYYAFEITICNECFIMDINQDQTINIFDVIILIELILEYFDPSIDQFCSADTNNDGHIDVLDILEIIQYILSS